MSRTTSPLAIYPLTGPPGAGKTTALMSVVRGRPDIARFGVRDYGLQLAREGHPLGLEIEGTLLRHDLLSNDQVRYEFMHFLDVLPPGVRSVAVEGYPRDPDQCGDLLDVVGSRGAHVYGFIIVDVPDQVAQERVAGRRICLTCGLPAESTASPTCRVCRGQVGARSDDQAERLARRLHEYRALGGKVRTFFDERGLLRTVDGLASPHEVQDRLLGILGAQSATPVITPVS